MKSTTSDPRYATTSQPTGAASSADTRNQGRRERNVESRRPGPPRGVGSTAVAAMELPLHLGPALHPLGVVRADRTTPVEALLRRSGPVPDLLEVVLVRGVERVAVVLGSGLVARLRV